MKIFDRHFRTHKLQYALQSMLIGLFMLGCVLLIGIRSNPIAATCLAASSVVVLAMPQRVSSRVVYVVGGYVTCILIAGAVYWLGRLCQHAGLFEPCHAASVALSCIAVAAAVFLMAATNTEHPPAAGLALSLVLGQWDFYLIAAVMVLVVGLVVVRAMLRRWVIDLL